MADRKHTQGPWRVEGPDWYGDFNVLPANETLAIGAVVRNGFRSDEETAANARLVGAADDLLTALEPFIQTNTSEEFTTITVRSADIAAARAAVAKATEKDNGNG